MSHFAVDDAALFTSPQTGPEPRGRGRGRGAGSVRQGCDLEVINRGALCTPVCDESSLFKAASAKKCAERKAAERLQTAEVVGGGPKDLQRRRVAGGSE